MSAELRARLRSATGRGVVVAVVDSGWSRSLADPRVLEGASVSACSEPAMDDRIGHGTACALRILQVAPGARVLPVRVFEDTLETSPGRICEAIEIARARGASVVNLSLATRRRDAIEPLFRACEAARRQGAVLVAAADNRGAPSVPADLEPVLSVAEGRSSGLLDVSLVVGGGVECHAAGFGVPIPGPRTWAGRRAGNSIAAATVSGIVARLVEIGATGLDDVRAWLARIAGVAASAATGPARSHRGGACGPERTV